ncbi:MAG: DUF47 family protein [Clostridia bacterium]|nr:DUF47 family protein [Clostridia bacterium]
MSKSDRFYFENLTTAADYCCKAADYLVECMASYNPENIKEMITKMHEIEHAADKQKHAMSTALAKAFVTPIDREDLAEMSINIDDVADNIEEVIQRFYVDDVRKVTPEAIDFSKKIADTAKIMKSLVTELENFKKPAKLHELIIELSNVEEECDIIYLESTRKIRLENDDVLKIIAWRKIYELMENCVDACEHVADSVGTIVMKNT